MNNSVVEDNMEKIETCPNCKHWRSSVREKHGVCNKHHRGVLLLMQKFAGIKETDVKAVRNFRCNYFEADLGEMALGPCYLSPSSAD